MGEFDGKVTAITGSVGIGLGAALKFAREGATVHLCGNDAAHDEKALNEADGPDVTVAEVDVMLPAQLGSWTQDVGSNGGIDILVNAPAVQTYGTTESTDIERWNRLIATNLTSCFLNSRFAHPFMKQQGGGAIVHVSSVQGHADQNEALAYATSKGGIHGLTGAQVIDAARDGIRVNSINPGTSACAAARVCRADGGPRRQPDRGSHCGFRQFAPGGAGRHGGGSVRLDRDSLQRPCRVLHGKRPSD